MNERILELAEQANVVIRGFSDKPVNHAELEEFAELILEDIDRIITGMYHTYPLEQAAALIDLDQNIKENFYGT
jgi:hypothetical protein